MTCDLVPAMYVMDGNHSIPFSMLTSKVRERNQRNFKPRILRPWSLLAVILVTLVLIGIVEYAATTLPHGPSFLNKLSSEAKAAGHNLTDLTPRDTDAAELGPRQPSASFSFGFPSISSAPGAPPSAFVPVSSSAFPSAIPPSAFVPVSSEFSAVPSSAFVPVNSPTTVGAPNPNALIATRSSGTGSSLPAPSAPAPTAFVPIDAPHGGSSSIFSGKPPTSPQATAFVHTDKNGRHFYPHWSGMDTFLGSYFATLLAALYRVLWTVIYCSFNLVEPLRALSQPEGAPADMALFSFYQSRSSFLGPIPALVKGRLALALVTFTAMLSDLLPAFASESTFVSTNWNCQSPDVTNHNNPCSPRIEVDAGALRILQALLSFAALVAFWLVYLHFVDKSCILEDPSSIATIATLAKHPDLIDDFHRIPPNATISETTRALRGRKYRLERCSSANGLNCYEIRPTAGSVDFQYTSLSYGGRSSKYPIIDDSFQRMGERKSRPRRIRPMDIILVILIAGLFGLILAYIRDTDYHDGFNNFFNSDSFGPRFILTLSGTAIASLWKSAEQSSVVNAPWNRLATTPSSAESTLLFKPSITPISSTFRAIRHGYYAIGAVTFVTLLADVGLNTVISGVAYTTGQTKQQFHASTYFCLVILGVMLVAAIMLIVLRLREVTLPRRPDTLGGVISYVAGSSLDYFEKREYMDDSSGSHRTPVMEKKYSLEQVAREDGRLAWMVIATYG